MGIFVSLTKPGFFNDEVHFKSMPEDAQEISEELYNSLKEDQMAGKFIDFNEFPPVAKTSLDFDLEKAKLNLKKVITKKCSSIIISGFTSNALGKVFTYPSAQVDQLNLNRITLLAMSVSGDSTWTTSLMCSNTDGIWDSLPHNSSQVLKVINDFNEHVTNVLEIKNKLLSDLGKAIIASDVESIKWPE